SNSRTGPSSTDLWASHEALLFSLSLFTLTNDDIRVRNFDLLQWTHLRESPGRTHDPFLPSTWSISSLISGGRFPHRAHFSPYLSARAESVNWYMLLLGR